MKPSFLLVLLPPALSACTLLAPVDEHSSSLEHAGEERPVYYFAAPPLTEDASVDSSFVDTSVDAGNDSFSSWESGPPPTCEKADSSICEDDSGLPSRCIVYFTPPKTCLYKGMTEQKYHWYCCQY